MKIIHTADLHLDSPMKANLDEAKAKERKNEITSNFARLTRIANELDAEAILIAGDLFDQKSITKKVARIVLNEIIKNSEIDFYYLKGNHDQNSFANFVSEQGEVPANLFMFDESWKKYILNPTSKGKKIALYGAEAGDNNMAALAASFEADPDEMNIVMLHGQENEYAAKDSTEVIPISSFKQRCVDYMALGHVHERKIKPLDSRGVYCYPGCLEGRGFDECGDHGFMLLDADEESGEIGAEFIDFAYRKLWHVETDISGTEDAEETVRRVRDEIRKMRIGQRDLIKIELVGDVDEETDVDESYTENAFKDDFYYVKAVNKTGVKIDYTKYENDESLKGWFIRLVRDSNESDEDKGRIVKMGIEALTGGTIG